MVGYPGRCDLPDDAEDEQTFWREYLLFNQMEGFAFLVDTQEGWSLVAADRRAQPGARRPGALGWRQLQAALGGTLPCQVTHVLGEFYWPVRLDDEALVTDYVSRRRPPAAQPRGHRH